LRRGDLLVAIALGLLFAGTFAVRFALRLPDGPRFGEVLVEGRVVHRVELAQGISRSWTIRNRGGMNLVVVEGGTIRFASADCPDGDCLRGKPLSLPGQTSLCLPHRVEIRVLGTGEKTSDQRGAPDAVSF
jgi:hypothetical protein